LGKCVNHPDRETSFLCMKHNTYLCEECLKCRDPNIYCKFRSSCPIWFLSKRKEGLDAEDKTVKSASGNKHNKPDRSRTEPKQRIKKRRYSLRSKIPRRLQRGA